AADGDGVQAWIVSSRHGEQGHWAVQLNRAETRIENLEVRTGDTIDFITDGRKNQNGDEYQWKVTIRRVGSDESWDSGRDFRRPATQPLNEWEKYVQVLLSAVEFSLID